MPVWPGRRWRSGLAAVVLGPVVPGVGRAVVDVHAFGVTLDVSRVELNPMVDIRPQLLAARRTELFTVRATAPAYWRLTALDRFDGRRWSPSRPALHRRDGPPPGRAGRPGRRPGAAPGLPAHRPRLAVAAGGRPGDPDQGGRRPPRPGDRLAGDEEGLPLGAGLPGGVPAATRTCRARLAAWRGPSAAAGEPEARPGPLPRPARPVPAAGAGNWPSGSPPAPPLPMPGRRRSRTTCGAGSATTRTPRPAGPIDALDHFLFTSRRGFCEQFAGAFAAMARAVGLPARVAVGFTPGAYDEADGVWRVTTREAHAWPEVFLDGARLDGVRAHARPGPPGPRRPGAGPTPPSSGWRRPARRRPAGRPVGAGPDRPGRRRPASTPAPGAARVGSPGRSPTPAPSGGWPPPPSASSSCRRRPRSGAGTSAAGAGADRVVLAAWAEALDRLGEAGLARRGAETPLEFAGRAGAVRPGVAPPLRRLAALVNRAAYGAAGGVGRSGGLGGHRPGRPGPRRPRSRLGPLAAAARPPAAPVPLRRRSCRQERGSSGPGSGSSGGCSARSSIEPISPLPCAAVAPDDEEHQRHAEDEQREPVAGEEPQHRLDGFVERLAHPADQVEAQERAGDVDGEEAADPHSRRARRTGRCRCWGRGRRAGRPPWRRPARRVRTCSPNVFDRFSSQTTMASPYHRPSRKKSGSEASSRSPAAR